jgi:hypothetical protein
MSAMLFDTVSVDLVSVSRLLVDHDDPLTLLLRGEDHDLNDGYESSADYQSAPRVNRFISTDR